MFRTAKLLDERYKAFDPLTAVFNTFHDTDNGNGNGNGELCHISQLCRVCEIYAEWQQRVREESVRREEKELVTAATTQRIFQTPKFVFDGRDVPAYLMQSLDFLSERRELVSAPCLSVYHAAAISWFAAASRQATLTTGRLVRRRLSAARQPVHGRVWNASAVCRLRECR